MSTFRQYSFLVGISKTLCMFFLPFLPLLTIAQNSVLLHSHNDYCQRVPLYQAYAQEVFSVEIDVFYEKGRLLVAHDQEELSNASSIDELYIEPIVKLFRENGGRPWKKSENKMQFLVDLKTETEPTLSTLITCLRKYEDVFDSSVNPYAVRVVISGNIPSPGQFANYPSFVFFDGSPDVDYSAEQLERVGIISAPFNRYSHWNGKGSIIAPEKAKVKDVIAKVHGLGKMIRFWGSPDYFTAWNTFHELGVDIINTDRVEDCTRFFHSLSEKTFRIGEQKTDHNIVKTDRLDKTTSGFSGFGEDSRKLSKGIAVYQPSYLNDGADKPVKNIILLIGDGMGLAHICATDFVNGGLSFLKLRHVGLQKTASKDAYTTDSAGAGSSIATGQSNNNRHIAMSEDGEIYPSLTEMLAPKDIACGIITLGNIADATPAAFYAHTQERDNSEEITRWLLKGNIDLLAGSGKKELTNRRDGLDLINELKNDYSFSESVDSINTFQGKVICLDERMAAATTEKTLSLLADATKQGIEKLSQNKKGFFLMVEGAKIDYAGHANSLPGAIVETLGFDLAVAEALRFADSNGETLVIVTSDHETGGLTLVDGNREKQQITAHFMTDDHTPIMVPVFAYGPGSQHFTGVYDNTKIFSEIMDLID